MYYKTGLKKSKGEYIIMIPGDNSHPITSIEPIIKNIGKSDIIIPFTTQKEKKFVKIYFVNIFYFTSKFIFQFKSKVFQWDCSS